MTEGIKFVTRIYNRGCNLIKDTVPVRGDYFIKGGDGFVSISLGQCEHHGDNQTFITGYNEGGYNSVSMCLTCCSEIYIEIGKDGINCDKVLTAREFDAIYKSKNQD